MKNIPYMPEVKYIVLLCGLIALLCGCSVLKERASQAAEGVATSTPTTTTTTTSTTAIRRIFSTIWKPASETRGHVLCIILGAKYRQDDFTRRVYVNGVQTAVKDWRNGYANGNRLHVFLRYPGASYGGPVTVALPLKDGSTKSWNVPNGAKRHETRN